MFTRKASVVDVSSESTQVSNVKADFANVTSSSYAVLDSGWVYQYDRFNDKYCWVQETDILQVSWQGQTC